MAPKVQDIFSWKGALIAHTIFFSLGLLQEEFYFGQLWFIMNCFVMFALLRATYADSSSNRLVAWYLYFVSIWTDMLSLAVFGGEDNRFAGIFGFCLAMAVILLLIKPVFAFFLYKHLKDEGVDIRRGMRTGTNALADQTYKGVDTEYVNKGNQNKNSNNENFENPGNYGFPDNGNQQYHSPHDGDNNEDENDFMSNIPPPTNNEANQAPNNQYGDYTPGQGNAV